MTMTGKRFGGKVALAIVTSALAGCVSEPTQSPERMTELRRMLDELPPGAFPSDTSTVVSRSQLQNKTMRASSVDIGTQVEYLGADGQAYLWISRNRRLVTGSWFVADSGHAVCFQYSAKPQCHFSGDYLAMIDEKASGDVFGLARGNVPFKLPYGQFSIAEIKRMKGN